MMLSVRDVFSTTQESISDALWPLMRKRRIPLFHVPCSSWVSTRVFAASIDSKSHDRDWRCGILRGGAVRGILLDNAFSVTLDTVGPLTDFARVMYGGGGADGSERGGVEDGTDGAGADGVSDSGSDVPARSVSELAPSVC